MSLPAHQTTGTARITRSVVWAIVIATVCALIIANRHDVPAATRAIRGADAGFVALALALVVVGLLNQAAFHAAAQRAAGLSTRPVDLVRAAAAVGFMNLVAKSGGMAGLAPMIGVSQRRGRSRGGTIAAYLLVNVLGHLAFAVMLAVSIAMLVADGRFTTVDTLAVVVFTVLTGIQLLLVITATRSRSLLRRLHSLPQRTVARVTRPLRRRSAAGSGTPEGTAADHSQADELFDAVQLLRQHPRRAVPAFAHALLVELIGITQLWCVLEAVGVHPRPTLPVLAYTVSVLFTIVGFLPGGLGFVDVGLGALLVSNGLTNATAAAAVVLYRVCELWLPFAIGAAATHSLAHRSAA